MPPKGKYNEKGDMVDEGMLEYLEDIIGSNKFIEPIKEMETKVEQLNEERAMKLSNVKVPWVARAACCVRAAVLAGKGQRMETLGTVI